MKPAPRQLVLLFVALLGPPIAMAAAKPTLVTSVYSQASPQYKRSWSGNTPQPEYYVIANGKYERGTAPDASIDKITFPEVAGVVADHLAKKGYHLAAKADGATLLLQVTWGTTQVFQDGNRSDNLTRMSNSLNEANLTMTEFKQANDAALQAPAAASVAATAAARSAQAAAMSANDALSSQLMRTQLGENARNEQNEAVARVIDYVDELDRRNDLSRFGGAGATYNDLVTELESARYYVRVTAYDFKKLRDQNKQVVLWTTVVSVDAQNLRFDEALATMVANAGRQFGQSNGLVRQAQDGTVTLGELKFAGPAREKADAKEKK